ncbi:spore germination protein [Paenibacillus paeoniae]|uniref:Uncharacterized protein n=1 Tax=Paenibacillus paeoniae TaxID=2292705 RepID=A0A371PLN7_9BACL|nr:spore germination protein [Paenibacillus paeoniae]REK76895.1 hypothetical protein DX130_07700 [Paenibacillus paeoniae]
MVPNERQDSAADSYTLCADLEENLTQFRAVFNNCGDIQQRQLELSSAQQGAFIFISGLSDISVVDMDLLKYAIESSLTGQSGELTEADKAAIRSKLSFTSHTSWSDDFQTSVQKVLSGELVVLLDGYAQALILNVKEMDTRSIEEPATEAADRDNYHIWFCLRGRQRFLAGCFDFHRFGSGRHHGLCQCNESEPGLDLY